MVDMVLQIARSEKLTKILTVIAVALFIAALCIVPTHRGLH